MSVTMDEWVQAEETYNQELVPFIFDYADYRAINAAIKALSLKQQHMRCTDHNRVWELPIALVFDPINNNFGVIPTREITGGYNPIKFFGKDVVHEISWSG